jgi:uroporphyrinogen decarboxylase
MRQAGRYLPEYRKVREQAGDFLTLCKTPELACEVTMQPLRRFDLDAAIMFSDILTIPDAMGQGLYFAEGEGPKFKSTIRSMADVEALPNIEVKEDLSYVYDGIRLMHKELKDKTPLIGFCGSPWTLATYMVEGGSSKVFGTIKRMLYSDPAILHALLEKLTTSLIDYLAAQVEAGVDALMIFDTWGGALSSPAYEYFSLNYMKTIIAALRERGVKVPIIMFTKNGGQWLEKMADSGANCLGLDWTTSIKSARQRVGHQVALQGNIDSAVLFGSEDMIHRVVSKTLAEFGNHSGHVFNLGHGIQQETDPGKVKYLVDLVHEMSAHYHR